MNRIKELVETRRNPVAIPRPHPRKVCEVCNGWNYIIAGEIAWTCADCTHREPKPLGMAAPWVVNMLKGGAK